MKTILKKIDKDNPQNNIAALKEAANILINDGLVAFPTETVYGLGANALKEDCVKKIYKAKGRPSDNPLILHISEIDEIYNLALDIPELAKKLMQKFWPGALTIILKKGNNVPMITSAGLDTVAIRMPSNKIARALIKQCGFPIAAPSANISGRPSPTTANHVFNDLNSKIDMIIDGGSCDFGLESTVVEVLEDEIIILRPGNVTEQMLADVCKNITIDMAILQKNSEVAPKSPGMKYKHYAPKGNITILKGDMNDIAQAVLQFLKQNTEDSLAILSDELIRKYPELTKYKILNIGSVNNQEEIGQNLFFMLRQCDNLKVNNIYVEALKEFGVGFAIMNRLKKAAGYNIINV